MATCNEIMELVKRACDENSLEQLDELYATVIKARIAPVDDEEAKMLDECIDLIEQTKLKRYKGIGRRDSRTALFEGITALWENAFIYGDNPVYTATELKKAGLEDLAPWEDMNNADREIYREYMDFLTGSWAKTHGKNIEPDITAWNYELVKAGRIDA
ncbi:MAG: hypothetical protein LUE27_06810 [Clostridia bacterium]|nr:hypothetical protein [Clostridia bacterium]